MRAGDMVAAAGSTGDLALNVIGVLVAAVVLIALVLAVVSVRRTLFERGGGTVECSLRSVPAGSADGEGAGGWRLGFGRYKGDELHWYRVFALRSRPRQVIHRRGLVISGRRTPTGEEAEVLAADAAIIELRDGDRTVELAMSSGALTGFLAWLEAAPPGFPIDLPG